MATSVELEDITELDIREVPVNNEDLEASLEQCLTIDSEGDLHSHLHMTLTLTSSEPRPTNP